MSIFDLVLIERLEAEFPGVDVLKIAARIAEKHQLSAYRSPNAMLRSSVRHAFTIGTDKREPPKADPRAEAGEYLAAVRLRLWCEVAAGRHTPPSLAAELANAAHPRFGAINPREIAMIRALGDQWPA